MKRALAAALLLAAAGPLTPQSLWFPDGLQAYRLNALVVTDLAPEADRPLAVDGRRFDGRRVALFRGLGVPEERGLRCWFYLDGDIGELEVRSPGLLRLSVETGPQIAVYGLEPPGSGFSRAGSPAALGPGDVFVPGRAGPDPETLRAAGIHVLLLGPNGRQPAEAPPSAWQGYLLRAPDLAAAGALLERERGRLLEFKERCLGAVRGARFQGMSLERRRELEFSGAGPADIAQTLQRGDLAARIEAPLGYALLAFCVPVLAAAAVLRRPREPLILAGVLLAGFVVFSLLNPGEVRSLRVEFPLPGESERPGVVKLEAVAPGSAVQKLYRQVDPPAGTPLLLYQAFLAPGGELPLQAFSREKMIRFNQVPEVRQEGGRLRLRFRNPLAAWSLHAPR